MEYRVKPIGRTCASTGEPLEPGAVCYSVLVPRDGDTVRLDFSEAAWHGPPDDAIGFWRRQVPLPDRPAGSSFDPEELYLSFEQLSEDLNPVQEKLRYVLALLLLKKRRLKLEDSREDEDDQWLIVSGSRGEGPFEVRNLQLPQEELNQLEAAVQAQLAAEHETAE